MGKLFRPCPLRSAEKISNQIKIGKFILTWSPLYEENDLISKKSTHEGPALG